MNIYGACPLRPSKTARALHGRVSTLCALLDSRGLAASYFSSNATKVDLVLSLSIYPSREAPEELGQPFSLSHQDLTEVKVSALQQVFLPVSNVSDMHYLDGHYSKFHGKLCGIWVAISLSLRATLNPSGLTS